MKTFIPLPAKQWPKKKTPYRYGVFVSVFDADAPDPDEDPQGFQEFLDMDSVFEVY